MSAQADLERADALRSQGFFVKSEPLYSRAWRSGDPELQIEAALGVSSALRSLARTSEAKVWAKRGLAVAKSLGLSEPAEALELELVMIDRADGLYAKSIRALLPYLRRFKARGDHSGEGFILWAIAGARRFSGDLAGSERDFWASLRAAKRARDAAGRAYALFGLGGITRVRGDLAASERHYREAGRLLARTDDVFGQAYAFCGLANSLRQQGRYDEARRLYERSHELYSRIGDRVDLAYVDWGLGKVFLQTGKLAEAERRLRLALSAFSAGREWRGVALSELVLAGLLHARGRTREGEERFARGVAVARKAGMRTHLESFT